MAKKIIKAVKLNIDGVNSIWKPLKGNSVIIHRVDVFGYCMATPSKPFGILVQVFQDNEWKTIGGLKHISNKDFILTFDFPYGLETDPGSGVATVLRVNLTSGNGKENYDAEASAIGNEFKRKR